MIADLENGRRRYVTTAEVIMLALALQTAPIALMYPGPYFDKMRLSPKSPELPEILAVEWFTGGLQNVSFDPESEDDDYRTLVQWPLLSAMNYHELTRPLRVARQVRDLDTRRKDVLREIGMKRGKVPDDEVGGLMVIADDLKRQIDEAQAPHRDFFEEMVGGQQTDTSEVDTDGG